MAPCDRAGCLAEPFRELRLGQAAVVAELQLRARRGREPPQLLLDDAALVDERGLFFARFGRRGLGCCLERLAAADVLAADEVDGAAMDERQDPRPGGGALREEAVGGAPDREKGLLDGVLREGLVAEDPQGEAVRDAAEAVVELGQGFLVGARDERKECLVGEARELPGARFEDHGDHVVTFSLWASGFDVGCWTPPFRSSVTATTEPEGTRRGTSTIEVPARPGKSPAGLARPLSITHAS